MVSAPPVARERIAAFEKEAGPGTDVRSPRAVPGPSERLIVWGGISAAWLLWGAINALRLAASPFLSASQAFWYGFPDAVVWAAFTPLAVGLARRVPIRRGRLARVLAFHVAASVGFGLMHGAVDAGIAVVRGLVTGVPTSWFFVFLKVLRFGLHTNMLVYALVIGLAWYVDHTRRLEGERRRAAELRALLAQEVLTNLERQLRPHFLFNALHTVSGLMGEDAEGGRRVVRRLGELLRASLKHVSGQRIPLSEEWELARAYLDIETARFEDRLAVDLWDGEGAAGDPILSSFPVPALVLQPLLENAVTHGVAPRPEGGRVTVGATYDASADRLVLTVTDDGPGFCTEPVKAEGRGFGIGLDNTRARLETLYGDGDWLEIGSASDDGGGTRVTVVLPRDSVLESVEGTHAEAISFG
ncbi:MAG: histidine kinase [Acidobacteriota bacterium]